MLPSRLPQTSRVRPTVPRGLRLALTAIASLAFVACSDGSVGTADPAPTTVVPAITATPAVTTLPVVAPTSLVPVATVDPAVPATTGTPPATVAPTPETVPAGAETAEPAETAAPDTTATTGPLDPLDDLDEDGAYDERCGTADLGAGLIVSTLCNTSLVPTPEGGVVPTAGSLLSLPSPSRWEDLVDVDATVRVATTPDGRRIVIYVLGSDTLFDSGQATVRSTAQPPIAAIVASITARYPASPIQIRGAADSVGSASANQTLSEQRAKAVASELTALGIDPARITAIGLGSAVPVALEIDPDGSVSDIGRQVNRRVEIVVG